MIRTPIAILLACVALAGCKRSSQQSTSNEPNIRVVSEEQKQLHQLDAFNLAIGLKRAIYDAGYTCKRVTDAGFVGIWENLDEVDRALRLRKTAHRATGRSSPGPTEARRCATARTSRRPDCRRASSSSGPKGSFTPGTK